MTAAPLLRRCHLLWLPLPPSLLILGEPAVPLPKRRQRLDKAPSTLGDEAVPDPPGPAPLSYWPSEHKVEIGVKWAGFSARLWNFKKKKKCSPTHNAQKVPDSCSLEQPASRSLAWASGFLPVATGNAVPAAHSPAGSLEGVRRGSDGALPLASDDVITCPVDHPQPRPNTNCLARFNVDIKCCAPR